MPNILIWKQSMYAISLETPQHRTITIIRFSKIIGNLHQVRGTKPFEKKNHYPLFNRPSIHALLFLCARHELKIRIEVNKVFRNQLWHSTRWIRCFFRVNLWSENRNIVDRPITVTWECAFHVFWAQFVCLHVCLVFTGISVYNVVVLCLIGVSTAYMIKEQVDASYTLISLFTFFATTLTICLIFIPKVSAAQITVFHLYFLAEPTIAGTNLSGKCLVGCLG